VIKKLNKSYKQQVLDFCYRREKENLFIIGSFQNYKDTFKSNKFYGYFKNDQLIGLGVFFTRFGSLVINARNKKVIESITDFIIAENLNIECVPVFKKYADVIIRRLSCVHKKVSKKYIEQAVFLLEKQNFQNFSDGTEAIAAKKDVDEIAVFATGKKQSEITEIDKKRVFPNQEFILRRNNRIISKANIHGVSENYFQIGGVGTLEAYRHKGYAKQIVSKLYEYFFKKGIKYGLLFTANDNLAAQKLYKSIGFKPVDEFVICEYSPIPHL